jgi:DNA polymerase-3 subunit delta
MILFLYGEDDYSSRQKLNEIIKKYKTKNRGGFGLHRINFLEKEMKDFKEVLEAKSIFKEKKLIILEEVFGQTAERQRNLAEYLKKAKVEADEGCLLIIREKSLPDRRMELFKFLIKKPAIAQEFKYLTGVKLESWIRKEFEKRKVSADIHIVKKLAADVGSNLWQMENEIEKIAFFGRGKNIKKDDIDILCGTKISNNIFNTVDALAERNKKKALRLLHQHLEEGEGEIYLITMFIRQFRNLLLVKNLLEKGIAHYELAKKTGLHPFVVKKTSEQARNFSVDGLKKIYSKLLDVDISIKTGKITAKMALDMLVMNV